MGNAPPKNRKQSHQFKKETLSYTICSMQGWRSNMEDTIIAISPFDIQNNETISLFGVFDGHGGASVANFVLNRFPQELLKNQSFQRGQYETALKQSLMKMDELLEMYQRQEIQKIESAFQKEKNPELEENQQQKIQGIQKVRFDDCGCTAIVCLITNDFIFTANIGDSRAVACQKITANHRPEQVNRSSQSLSYYVEMQLSKDHKPELDRQQDRILKAGGTVKNGRINGQLNLSRAIGDLKYKKNQKLSKKEQIITAQPDIVKIAQQNIQYLIIGCDGIWEVKTAADMVEWINQRLQNLNRQYKQKRERSKLSMSGILEQLFDELIAKDKNQQTGKDNMSAILVKLQDRRSQWFKPKKRAFQMYL